MTRIVSTAILLLLTGALGPSTVGGSVIVSERAALHAATATADTVHVAPPTGETETDRANVQAALEGVEPGGTVRFGPGTYLVGEIITVAVPEVTLLGHPDGTTLRGCEPSAFEDRDFAVAECNGLSLTGGHQAVRDLTFEYTWVALILGGPACEAGDCPPETLPIDARTGGHVVEQNTFRYTPNGIRVVGEWSEPAVIRDNKFLNTYHAVVVRGRTAHIRDNEISVPEPVRVPYTGHPGGALALVSSRLTDDRTSCAGNVIAGNHIEGHPDAIVVFTQPGMTCRGHEIRENVILVRRTPFASARDGYIQMSDDADSTVVGIPIALYNAPTAILGPADGSRADGVIEENVIEGNRVIGAEGIGILVLRSSHNRIADNVITGVERRAPFPGNLLLPSAPLADTWREANGSGIWISPGSDGNEVVGNTFEDVAGDAVVIEGDGNRVELRGPADSVHDLGSGNRVIGLEPDGEAVGDRDQPTAQDAQSPILDARFANVGGLRLEYFSFGDSGIPVVWVQDHHDYFREATFGLEQAEEWVAFLERFADAFRVLAPVRRGWGASDDPGYGFDVATQAEDLLGLLDALGIDRAVFVGRTIATQELTWVAEHHPERVIGLVYLGTPHVTGTGQFATPTPAVERWAEMYNRVACDIGTGNEVDRRLHPRNAFRAHFTEDPDVRIDIPTLLSLHPLIDREGHNLRRLDWLEAGELGGDEACDAEAGAYFDELARSPARIAELRRAFQEEAKALVRVRERMERAFGDRLTVVWEPDEFGLEPWYASIRPFLESLSRRAIR